VAALIAFLYIYVLQAVAKAIVWITIALSLGMLLSGAFVGWLAARGSTGASVSVAVYCWARYSRLSAAFDEKAPRKSAIERPKTWMYAGGVPG